MWESISYARTAALSSAAWGCLPGVPMAHAVTANRMEIEKILEVPSMGGAAGLKFQESQAGAR
jgi:hypothetical protein